MLDLFPEFIQDEEHSILLSSHITSDLEKVADYITFIHAGKIVFSKTKDDILEQYGVVKCEKTRAAAWTARIYQAGATANSTPSCWWTTGPKWPACTRHTDGAGHH